MTVFTGPAAPGSGREPVAPAPPIGLSAAAAFACGLVAREYIAVVGQFYLAEMLLPLLAVLLVVFGRARAVFADRLFIGFAVAGMLSLLGYLLSDLLAQTETVRSLKGSGRVVLLVLASLSLLVLAAHDRRLPWWFLLGLAVGSLARLAVTGVSLVAEWKLGWGYPLQVLALAVGGLGPAVAAAVLSGGLGVIHILLDSRILGVLAVATAGILVGRSGPRHAAAGTGRQVLLIGALVMLFLGGGWWLLVTTGDDYGERRTLSNTARFAGLEVGAAAIAASPLIGYGSWTESREFAQRLRKTIRDRTDFQSRRRSMYSSQTLFRQHSQILQAWVEGGLLGAAFFFFYGYWLGKALWAQVTRVGVDRYYALYLYTTMAGLWHLLMSPFGGQARLDIAAAVAVIFLVIRDTTVPRPSDALQEPAPDRVPLRLRYREPAADDPAVRR